MQDFSIKEEIKIILSEVLKMEMDVNEILEDVVQDELLLTTISMSIFETIAQKTNNEEAQEQLIKCRQDMVEMLVRKGVL